MITLTNKSSGAVTTYRYDALGRRITKNFPDPVSGTAQSRRYVMDGARVLEEHDTSSGADVPMREFVYGVGLDEPVRMRVVASNSFYYYAQNAIGSIVALMDSSGNVVERYGYTAFGRDQVTDASGNVLPASQFDQPYRFQGRWKDEAEGSPLTYFRWRMYSADQGRFLQRDPIGTWGDARQNGNAYAFCGGNPLNGRDPFGLFRFQRGLLTSGEDSKDRVERGRNNQRTFAASDVAV